MHGDYYLVGTIAIVGFVRKMIYCAYTVAILCCARLHRISRFVVLTFAIQSASRLVRELP